MSQSMRRSTIESALVTAVAVSYAVPINYVFLQHIHWEPWLQATVLTLLFTVLNFLLKLATRRFFNWLDEKFPS